MHLKSDGWRLCGRCLPELFYIHRIYRKSRHVHAYENAECGEPLLKSGNNNKLQLIHLGITLIKKNTRVEHVTILRCG